MSTVNTDAFLNIPSVFCQLSKYICLSTTIIYLACWLMQSLNICIISNTIHTSNVQNVLVCTLKCSSTNVYIPQQYNIQNDD